MSKLKTLLLSAAFMTGMAALSACETVPDSQKDYTVKTVKWSPAPRDKFYRVVKVPKSAEPQSSGTASEPTSSKKH